jgi:hypothetical protein
MVVVAAMRVAGAATRAVEVLEAEADSVEGEELHSMEAASRRAEVLEAAGLGGMAEEDDRVAAAYAKAV